MLGGNRATVMMSAIALQSAGYSKYARGLITVTERAGLEAFACDCCRTVRAEYERLQNQSKSGFFLTANEESIFSIFSLPAHQRFLKTEIKVNLRSGSNLSSQ